MEEGDVKNIRHWLCCLSHHGYVDTFGKKLRGCGGTQPFILLKSPVSMPIVCDVCGRNIYKGGCTPLFLNQETKKETKKETEPEAGSSATTDQWLTIKQLTGRRHIHER
jgi:hypothetical protein